MKWKFGELVKSYNFYHVIELMNTNRFELLSNCPIMKIYIKVISREAVITRVSSEF